MRSSGRRMSSSPWLPRTRSTSRFRSPGILRSVASVVARRSPSRWCLAIATWASCWWRSKARRASRSRCSSRLRRSRCTRSRRCWPHSTGARCRSSKRLPSRGKIIVLPGNPMSLQSTIDAGWEARAALTPDSAPADVREAVATVIDDLDTGRVRVAEKTNGEWITHQWIKKAVLLSFRLAPNMASGASGPATAFRFYDKVATKFAQFDDAAFAQAGVRVVPPAVARRGAYIARNVVLMPSYVNVGAYVDEGTMVDTWATVGSCAQIGRNVHLSGGVGIGGVLEPLQANPTIIEDNCFVGARSEVVEGVIVEENSVLGMGVFIGQSTKIFDRASGRVSYGRVPAGSVVVAGSLPSEGCQLYCAVIVKRVDAKTRAKTSINELLRS